jgi:hypothetical protein
MIIGQQFKLSGKNELFWVCTFGHKTFIWKYAGQKMWIHKVGIIKYGLNCFGVLSVLVMLKKKEKYFGI